MDSCSLFSCFPAELILTMRLGRGEEHSRGKCPPPDSDPFNTPSLAEFTQTCQEIYPQRQIAASSSRDAVNFSSARTMETLSVAAVCINNPIVDAHRGDRKRFHCASG